MAVPEAAVHEYHSSSTAQNQIWTSWQILAVKRVAQTAGMQEAADRHLGRGMLTADAPHQSGARLFGRRKGGWHASESDGPGDIGSDDGSADRARVEPPRLAVSLQK